MNLYNNLKSDLYKFFHTPLWIVHLIIPFVGAALFLWCYSGLSWDETTKLAAYIQILSVTFPVLIGIIISMLTEEEQGAGDFQLLLSAPSAKYIAHISKIIVLLIFGFVSSLLALVLFGIGFIKMGYVIFDIIFYFKVACLLFFSVLPLYLIHYIVGFIKGKGYCISLGILGGLVSALLLTGLGDGVWWMLPWGIAARFSETLLVSDLANIEFLNCSGIIISIVFILLFSAAFSLLIFWIFRKWEGRKSQE